MSHRQISYCKGSHIVEFFLTEEGKKRVNWTKSAGNGVGWEWWQMFFSRVLGLQLAPSHMAPLGEEGPLTHHCDLEAGYAGGVWASNLVCRERGSNPGRPHAMLMRYHWAIALFICTLSPKKSPFTEETIWRYKNRKVLLWLLHSVQGITHGYKTRQHKVFFFINQKKSIWYYICLKYVLDLVFADFLKYF